MINKNEVKGKYRISIFDARNLKIKDFYLSKEKINLPFTYPNDEPFDEFAQQKSFIPANVFKNRHGLSKNSIYTIYTTPEQDEFLKKYYPAYFAEDGKGMPIKGGVVVFGNHYSEKQIGDINTCLQYRESILSGNEEIKISKTPYGVKEKEINR